MRSNGDGVLGCLGDLIGEIALAMLACGLLALVGYGFRHAPVLTAGVVVPIAAFACYGGALFIGVVPPGRRAQGRLAVAAVATAALVALLLAYGVIFGDWWP